MAAEMRFNNNKGTAPVVSELKNEELPIKKSQFDLSRKVFFAGAPFWLIPFDCIETLPDSDYEISIDLVALSSNPLVKRLLSSMDIYVHVYAANCYDLCEGFPRFVTRGRSGKFTADLPMMPTAIKGSNQSPTVSFISTPFSPSAFLGVPYRSYPDKIKLSDDNILSYLSPSFSQQSYYSKTTAFFGDFPVVNALPFVMYQQICVLNYMPSNLLFNDTMSADRGFFPDNEQHFRLSAAALGKKDIVALAYDVNYASLSLREAKGGFDIQSLPSMYSQDVWLDQLRVRMYKGDDFNTGLPFPDLIRGDVPSVSFGDTTIPKGTLLTDGLSLYLSPSGDTGTALGSGAGVNLVSGGSASLVFSGTGAASGSYGIFAGNKSNPISVVTSQNIPVSISSIVTLNQLRALEVLTIFRERMARCDGSYNEMIKAQYNASPKYREGKPIYVGGFKQEMVFSEVVQSSESSSSTPLGTTASRAITAGNGYIGRYHSNDFGYIMCILSVVPNTVYASPRIPKMFSRVSQDQFYFPIEDNLAPESILRKELFYRGISAQDNDIFAYQERNYEYKSRQDVAVGWMSLPHSASDDAASYIAARRFGASPTLSYSFVAGLPSSFDYGIFSNEYDPPFIFAASVHCKAIQPMPYVTVPGSLRMAS